jgi:hypothetical protein
MSNSIKGTRFEKGAYYKPVETQDGIRKPWELGKKLKRLKVKMY